MSLTGLTGALFLTEMPETYTAYEAKAKLGEILRKVRSGQRVLISYRGEEIAEVRPLYARDFIEARMQQQRERGTLSASSSNNRVLKKVAKRPGALHRFLDSRD